MRIRPVILFVVLAGLLTFSACKKTDSSEGFDVLNFSDDTTAAAQIVSQANEDLNKIKVMYKKNEVQREELIAAMSAKDAEKVKKITDDLVYLINDGIALGEGAVEKIVKAQQMNINPDFKEYLSLKEESLRKQLEAFESRRQAVRLLRDSFGTNDSALVEKAKQGLKDKEEDFAKMMEESKKISKKANDLAKESSKKTRE
ncbi:MAG TPA: hypothetical protein VK308_15300 [Pyrinomonadaceae bacterium]|nr:hypothetical protein [Pyrinomonadaceae bacterium]